MKKLFKKAIEWLRRRVTALRSEEGKVQNEEVKNMRSVYDNLSEAKGKRVALSSQHPTPQSAGDTLMLRMEEFVAERYEVRYNRLSQQYELVERGGCQWMRLDDELCYRLMMEMNHEGIAITKSYLVRAVVQGGGLAQRYHPVCSYLESLPQWDGQGHIEALFRRITDDEQLLRWLRKWFIGMVAQVMGRMGTYGNSVCPILISRKQGWGKSQFAKMLVPPQLRVFYTDTFNLQQEDACLRRMTAYMLINVDEIDRFKDTRMATFKNMVQLAGVSMKRTYHSQMEEKERMASFIATSNKHYLLHDESGSRRFICVELTHAIDTDTPINYAQLYAEAMAALEAGERCWMDEEETRQLEKHNAHYAASRGVWDLLNEHFTPCDLPESTEEKLDALWAATEVYDYLYEVSPAAMGGIERTGFGHYLKRMGAPQARVKNRRLYGVKLRMAA